LNNTVIAIAADHGEMLGDYNQFAKSMPWDGSARVPMIFAGQNIKANRVLSQPVTTLDIVGTFLDLAGAEFAANMTTQSMLSLLTGDENQAEETSGVREFVLSGLGGTTFVGDPQNEDYSNARRLQSGPGRVNWRMVVKQMNETSTLKLVCCPTGCAGINGNSTLFPESSTAQVGLFEIGGDRFSLERDLLSRGIGKSEASEMLKHLPIVQQAACSGVLNQPSEVVV